MRVCVCVFWVTTKNGGEREEKERERERKSARTCFASKARLAANQSAGASLRGSTIESITGWPGGAGSI